MNSMDKAQKRKLLVSSYIDPTTVPEIPPEFIINTLLQRMGMGNDIH